MKISFTARLLIYCGVLTYVAVDLYACKGPLRQAINRRRIDSAESIEEAKKSGIAAIVLGRPITTSQVERATRERLWLEGKAHTDVTKEYRTLVRKAVLGELVDHQLIRSKIAANRDAEKANDEEVSERVNQLVARFSSRAEMEESMTLQGIGSADELRLRITATIEMEKYLARQIMPLLVVSDDEIEDFYAKHQSSLALPEMVRARHVFFAGLGHEPGDVKQRAENALAQWQSKKKTFEQLAAEQSEDERSKTNGGDLGWLTRDRLAADFIAPLFALPLEQPMIFQSKLGWHLAEVTERREAKPRTLDECRDEIYQALSDQKIPEALLNLRAAIRQSHKDHVHLYMDVIDGMP